MPPDGGAQKVQHGGHRLQKKYLILQTLYDSYLTDFPISYACLISSSSS